MRARLRQSARLGLIPLLVYLSLTAVGSISVRANPSLDPESFISSVSSLAQAEMQDSGVPASFSIAQASYESNWTGISGLAATYNNYHGISCSEPNEGLSCVELSGREWNRFSSASVGFLWHGRWLHGNPRYAQAFSFVDEPDEFARRVAAAGYCPPPDCDTDLYAQIVNERVADRELTLYDDQQTPFVGVYYSSVDLSGNPVFSEPSASIDFDWGDGGPCNSYRSAYCLGVDNFSIGWKAKVGFEAGRYRFHTVADDGIRVWVDGNLIIDQWHDHLDTESTGDTELSAGLHWIRVEYVERRDAAMARLWWEPMKDGIWASIVRWWKDWSQARLNDLQEWWEARQADLGELWEQTWQDLGERFQAWLISLAEWAAQEIDQLMNELCGGAAVSLVLVAGPVLAARRRDQGG